MYNVLTHKNNSKILNTKNTQANNVMFEHNYVVTTVLLIVTSLFLKWPLILYLNQ